MLASSFHRFSSAFSPSPPPPTDDARARNIVDVDITNRDNIDKAESTAVYRIK